MGLRPTRSDSRPRGKDVMNWAAGSTWPRRQGARALGRRVLRSRLQECAPRVAAPAGAGTLTELARYVGGSATGGPQRMPAPGPDLHRRWPPAGRCASRPPPPGACCPRPDCRPGSLCGSSGVSSRECCGRAGWQARAAPDHVGSQHVCVRATDQPGRPAGSRQGGGGGAGAHMAGSRRRPPAARPRCGHRGSGGQACDLPAGGGGEVPTI